MAVAFDAVATGSTTASTSFSYSHTATAGSYVVVAVAFGAAFSGLTVTYGGSAMTLLGSVSNNNTPSGGGVYFYGKASVPGGAQTVAGSWTTSNWYYSTAISYTGVSSVGTAVTTYGLGATLSQGPVSASGGVILQAFGQGQNGIALTSLTGGTNRFNQYASFVGLALNEAPSTTTFGATASGKTSDDWSGLAIVLNSSTASTNQFFAMF